MRDLLPVILVISGFDPTHHAGHGRDLQVAARLGVYPVGVITAVTHQLPGEFSASSTVSSALITRQLEALFRFYEIQAVKVGMVHSLAVCEAIFPFLEQCRAPIVIDPILNAGAGPRLLQRQALPYYREKILPRATLITPNLPEAVDLAAVAKDCSPESLCRVLHGTFGAAVLLKGGHSGDNENCRDLFYDGAITHTWIRRRLSGLDTHGTGCTLSTAIAAHLALGVPLVKAIDRAETFMTRVLENPVTLNHRKYLGI